MQNNFRWLGPKAPPYVVKNEIPELLDALLEEFLPVGLGGDQKESEKSVIEAFIQELNQIRKYHVQRDFSNSYVVNNVTSLLSAYPFVNKFN